MRFLPVVFLPLSGIRLARNSRAINRGCPGVQAIRFSMMSKTALGCNLDMNGGVLL